MLAEAELHIQSKTILLHFAKHGLTFGVALGALYGITLFPLNMILTTDSEHLGYSIQMGLTVGLFVGCIVGGFLGLAIGLVEGILVATFARFMAEEDISGGKFSLVVQLISVAVMVLVLLLLVQFGPQNPDRPLVRVYFVEAPWVIALLASWYSSRRLIRIMERKSVGM